MKEYCVIAIDTQLNDITIEAADRLQAIHEFVKCAKDPSVLNISCWNGDKRIILLGEDISIYTDQLTDSEICEIYNVYRIRRN